MKNRCRTVHGSDWIASNFWTIFYVWQGILPRSFVAPIYEQDTHTPTSLSLAGLVPHWRSRIVSFLSSLGHQKNSQLLANLDVESQSWDYSVLSQTGSKSVPSWDHLSLSKFSFSIIMRSLCCNSLYFIVTLVIPTLITEAWGIYLSNLFTKEPATLL